MTCNFFVETPFISFPISKKTWAILGTSYTAIALALVPVFVRLSEVGPIATAFYRFFLSFPFLMTWMIFDRVKTDHGKTPESPRDFLLILGSGAFLALDITFWHWSILHTTVVNATLLNNLTTIFVTLSSWLFLKQKISPSTKKGVFLAVLGSIILVGHNFTVNTDNLFGDFLALISAFFFTAFIITIKELRLSFRSPTILAWGALPTMYILAIIAYVSGDNFSPVTPMGWMPLLGMAFLVHILGQGLMTYSMGHMSATLSSLIVGMSPAFAAFFAWVMFNEALTWVQMVGAAVVLSGIYVAKKSDLG